MNVTQELKKAKEDGYAVGAFNTNNLEVTKAICKAASRSDMPILIQTTPSAIMYAGLEQIFDIVRNEVESTGIKGAIHLDHAKNFETVKMAIDAGWRSVMIDASLLAFDDNVALTKKVVEYAKATDTCVEAEIGVLKRQEGGEEIAFENLSQPETVKKFVDLTGIDSVAVSIGNVHGAPAGEHLDLNLLSEISKVVDIPIVIHGASGLSEDDIRSAIKIGAAKFNIDTQIRHAFIKPIEESTEKDDYRKPMEEGMVEVEKVVDRYIKLFSNKIKA
ncbi:MAG TPA: class II fructose-bisphosphate aldolase [bacterium]|nr:class II fructose-bisphosphate aldolase [bacterium]